MRGSIAAKHWGSSSLLPSPRATPYSPASVLFSITLVKMRPVEGASVEDLRHGGTLSKWQAQHEARGGGHLADKLTASAIEAEGVQTRRVALNKKRQARLSRPRGAAGLQTQFNNEQLSARARLYRAAGRKLTYKKIKEKIRPAMRRKFEKMTAAEKSELEARYAARLLPSTIEAPDVRTRSGLILTGLRSVSCLRERPRIRTSWGILEGPRAAAAAATVSPRLSGRALHSPFPVLIP